MRPPTPAMLARLRWYASHPPPSIMLHGVGVGSVDAELSMAKLITLGDDFLWHLTDAGRRVLAEHTTGDGKA